MAPAAKLVIQDAGYAADSCGDLPGIGCPVTDLNPVFQQAYAQGARVHSNSWNDNENGAVQNNYTDASVDVDEFMWNHPDFLIVFACGNHALGGVGTIGSPSTAKNGMATGGTYNGQSAIYLSDISAWGPTDDGRIKPDVLFPGASIQSARNDKNVTTNNCGTGGSTGTSMTAPGVSGMALLTREYFMNGWYPTGAPVPANGFTPTAALLKAMLVNSAVAIPFDAEGRPITIPGNEQGWGRVLLDNALHFAGDSARAVGRRQRRELHLAERRPGDLPARDGGHRRAAQGHAGLDRLPVDPRGRDEPRSTTSTCAWTGRTAASGGTTSSRASRSTAAAPDRLNNLEQVLIPNAAAGQLLDPDLAARDPRRAAVVRAGRHRGPLHGHLRPAARLLVPRGRRCGAARQRRRRPGPGRVGEDPGHAAQRGRRPGDLGRSARSTRPTRALLKVYDGIASFPDMAVGAQGASAAPHYDVTLEPSAACGQILGATMDITGNGFDVGSAFDVRHRDLPEGLPVDRHARGHPAQQHDRGHRPTSTFRSRSR